MFAPIVVVVRSLMGKAQFNKLRGQAIAKHSQVITNGKQSSWHRAYHQTEPHQNRSRQRQKIRFPRLSCIRL